MIQSLKYDPWEDPPLEELDEFDPRLDVTDKEADHPLEALDIHSFEDGVNKLSDKWWRLNNLYFIINKFGQRVLFRPNSEQTRLYDNLWYLNLILKARQRGFTTFIDIYFLDECIFNSDTEAGIIAHNREDVSKIFRRKILYPYENLPEAIKSFVPTKSKSKTEIEFFNNSIISVGTSMRSGTLNLLHVSEFGKVCARFPEKAREIVTGSFETIHTQTGESLLFVESTAEGKVGYFHDYCKDAQDRDKMGRAPTMQEFRFHFFPWWDNNENEQHEPVPITSDMLAYFEKVEAEIGQPLSNPKRYWYVTKYNRLGEDMKREHPSTPEEAFEQSIKGAYFEQQFTQARREGRICSVPYQPGILVDTWWDLGMNDVMAIWFTQDVGREIHVIDYLEGSGEGFDYYKDELDKKGYIYGKHGAPHDITVRELGAKGKSRLMSAREIGIHFFLIPRVKAKIDSINSARRIFPVCWFDETNTAKGRSRLENYRKKWNEHTGTYENNPLHDVNSNGADAFQTFAMGHNFKPVIGAARPVESVPSGGWT